MYQSELAIPDKHYFTNFNTNLPIVKDVKMAIRQAMKNSFNDFHISIYTPNYESNELELVLKNLQYGFMMTIPYDDKIISMNDVELGDYLTTKAVALFNNRQNITKDNSDFKHMFAQPMPKAISASHINTAISDFRQYFFKDTAQESHNSIHLSYYDKRLDKWPILPLEDILIQKDDIRLSLIQNNREYNVLHFIIENIHRKSDTDFSQINWDESQLSKTSPITLNLTQSYYMLSQKPDSWFQESFEWSRLTVELIPSMLQASKLRSHIIQLYRQGAKFHVESFDALGDARSLKLAQLRFTDEFSTDEPVTTNLEELKTFKQQAEKFGLTPDIQDAVIKQYIFDDDDIAYLKDQKIRVHPDIVISYNLKQEINDLEFLMKLCGGAIC